MNIIILQQVEFFHSLIFHLDLRKSFYKRCPVGQPMQKLFIKRSGGEETWNLPSFLISISVETEKKQWRIQDFPKGAPTPKGDAPIYYFGNFFPKKLHHTERKLDWEGVRVPSSPLDPPMTSSPCLLDQLLWYIREGCWGPHACPTRKITTFRISLYMST